MKMYILEGHEPKPVEDIKEWGKAFEGNRIVASTRFKDDTIHVSTVFLGLDHNWLPNNKPQLFETMIFGGEHDLYQDRCSTWDEALEMHDKAIKLVNEVKE